MNKKQLCAKCSAALPQDAPGGFCPQCLLEVFAGHSSKGGALHFGESHCGFGDYELLRTLFNHALEVPPNERDAFVRAACGADAEFYAEVAALLRAAGVADEWLKDDQRANPPASISEGPGAVIGRYKLLQQIGEGGFGVVYMTEQQEPVRRKVALKIIKLGMDTRSIVARFEAERQALALMDHPHIAKVLDAGTTDTGRPYFVMELVRGVPITMFCDENQVTLNQRLELFIQVCNAIQHAHQKGIIHRDLKPTNVLVTLNDGVPHPMVIDFGVAKALNQRLTEKTLFTHFTQMIGTPAYMSPEQAEMSKLDVDTRSDIYSLGVLLYELLTGTTPFPEERLRNANYAAMQRIICEEEPEKPSTRATKIRAAADMSRRIPQSAIQNPKSKIERDLDWIVMKCLEKDRTRRYDSVSGLGGDLKRFLRNEPVGARPPSRFYRLQKLARRNQLAFAAIAGVAAALLLGLIGSTWQAIRATRAERQQSLLREQAEIARGRAETNELKARTEATRSQYVAHFMKRILEGVGPSVAKGRDTTMLREILNQTAAHLGDGLKDEPAVEAELRHTIGDVYWALGEYDKAEQMLRQSLAIRRTLPGSDDLALADVLYSLATVLRYRTKHDEAFTLLRQALPIQTNRLGNAHAKVAQTLYQLTLAVEFSTNRLKVDDLEALYRDALATRRQLFGEEYPDIALLLRGLGVLFHVRGKLNEAESLCRQSLAMGRKLLGEDHDDTVRSLNYLGDILLAQRKSPEAESVYRQVLAIFMRLYGDNHPNVANGLHNVGQALLQQGKLSEAESLFRHSLATGRKVSGENYDVVIFLGSLCAVVSDQKRLPEAESLYRDMLAMCRRVYGDDHVAQVNPLEGLSRVLGRQGKSSEAENLRREALMRLKKHYGDGNPIVANSLVSLGYLLRRRNPIEAVSLHREAVDLLRKTVASDHLGTLPDAPKVAEGQSASPRYQNLTIKTNLPASNAALAYSLRNLAGSLRAQGKWPEAKSAFLEAAQSGDAAALDSAAWFLATCADGEMRDANLALDLAEKTVNATQRKTASFLDTLAAAYAAVGQYTEAASAQQEAIALEGGSELKSEYQARLSLFQSNSPYLEYWRMGAWLRDKGKAVEAETMYRQELAQRRIMFGDDHPQVAASLGYLAAVLYERGKHIEAEGLVRECLSIGEKHTPDDWLIFDARRIIGGALLAQQCYDEAEPLLRSADQGLKECRGRLKQSRLTECLQHLVQLYEATGQPEKALECKLRLAALP